MKESNLFYQHLGAYSKMCKDLVNLQTKFSCFLKLYGWSMTTPLLTITLWIMESDKQHHFTLLA